VHEAEQWVAAAEKGIGMKIQWSPKFSSNELWTRVQSEAPNFNADMIWGFMNAHAIVGKELGYFIPYKSPTWKGIPDQFKDPDGHWYGIDYWFAPWVANKNLLKAKNLPVPKAWKDLLNPAYKGEIVMPNPGTSGTAFLHISTVMMIYGEKKGWEYLDKLNKNVAQYTKSGTAPAQLVATGEYAIGLSWDMAVYGRAEKGFPIIPIIPSEGVGANLDSIAILKGCKNLEGAKKLVDWSGTVEGQTVFGTTRAKVTRPGVPSLAKIKPKLIVYDAKWAGENQRRIMSEWKKRFQK
jgi:iron(III) transport system substrate-binding protein